MSTQSQDNRPASNTSDGRLLDSLRFLLGQWQAVSKPRGPSGGFSFISQLRSRVIVRTNYAHYPATEERPSFHHEDLMVIYEDEGQNLRADYYDSEGHVIRYSGEVIETNKVIFTSASTNSSPRFRLSYLLDEDGSLIGSFEMALPNQPDQFTPYLSWSAIKSPERTV
jgi:hypothetical protein